MDYKVYRVVPYLTTIFQKNESLVNAKKQQPNERHLKSLHHQQIEDMSKID